jgi:hypothetical protein
LTLLQGKTDPINGFEHALACVVVNPKVFDDEDIVGCNVSVSRVLIGLNQSHYPVVGLSNCLSNRKSSLVFASDQPDSGRSNSLSTQSQPGSIAAAVYQSQQMGSVKTLINKNLQATRLSRA